MSLNIVLLGYGKMGRMIEKIAIERGHKIALRIDEYQEELFDSNEFKSANVVIEFTQPEAAARNCRMAIERGLPVVSGTTGWSKELKDLSLWLKEDSKRTLFWASNFSVGVNLFFEMNRRIAQLMKGFKEYKLNMSEVHHIHKLDAPSGTAITLAEHIIDEYDGLDSWHSLQSESLKPHGEGILEIDSIRQGEVAGIHTVKYTSSVDEITLEHNAFGREGFALGAVLAAEFVQEHKGILSMKDMLAGL